MALIRFRGRPGNDAKFAQTLGQLMAEVSLHLHGTRLLEIRTTVVFEKSNRNSTATRF